LATIIYQRVSTSGLRDDFGFMPPRPRGEFRSLGLSKEQRESLRLSRERLHEAITPQQTLLREKKQQLLTEIGLPDPDTALIYSLLEEIGEIHTRMQRQVIDNILIDGAFLDPQQRKRLLEMIEERTCRMGPGKMSHGKMRPGFRNKSKNQQIEGGL